MLRDLPKPRYALGDRVKVSQACDVADDWGGAEMVIIGVGYDRSLSRVQYTTLEPGDIEAVQSGRRSGSGGTDGWCEEDLTPVL